MVRDEPPRRVLVVEDEAMVAMLIEDLLRDLGCQVTAVATTATEALRQASRTDIDFALLDINLGGGETSFQAAAVLSRLKTPFAWLTGYGIKGVPPQFQSAPVLDKPIDPDLFADVVRALA